MAKASKYPKFDLRMDPDLYDWLRTFSAKTGKPMAAIIKDELQQLRREEILKTMKTLDAMQGYDTNWVTKVHHTLDRLYSEHNGACPYCMMTVGLGRLPNFEIYQTDVFEALVGHVYLKHPDEIQRLIMTSSNFGGNVDQVHVNVKWEGAPKPRIDVPRNPDNGLDESQTSKPVPLNTVSETHTSEVDSSIRIKVIGVGNAGCHTVEKMAEAEGFHGVAFHAVNTDVLALMRQCEKVERVYIGQNTTKQQGTGTDLEKGRRAAEEDKDKLKAFTEGADIVFIVAGLGGGTGTGVAPMIARLAKETGALTIGAVSCPFDFEGKQRALYAEEGLDQMCQCADAVIVISTEYLVEKIDPKLPIRAGFALVDTTIQEAVQCIIDLVRIPGEIDIDFAQIKSILSNTGRIRMGMGCTSGENRAQTATKAATSSILFEGHSIEEATNVIINITAGSDMMMHELEEAMEVIRKSSENVQVIFGLSYDDNLQNELRVTVIATGIDSVNPTLDMP